MWGIYKTLLKVLETALFVVNQLKTIYEFIFPLQMSTARFKPGVSLTLSRFLNGLMILNFTIKLCNSLHIDPYLEADNIRKVSQNPRENFKMRKILGKMQFLEAASCLKF